MKNILFGLLATLLFSNFTFAQLMSDQDHRTMMDTYAVNLNTILTANCPAGKTLDQYKKGIVNGTYALNTTAKNQIIAYAIPLKTYGAQFATAKGLFAYNDALKYFYSTFAPSTQVQGAKLVENTTEAGITAAEMWSCALESFSTDDCGSSAVVSDKYSLSMLATTSVSKLTAVPSVGSIGVLVMLDGFSDCLHHYYQLEQAGFAMSHDAVFTNTINSINTFNNQPKNQGTIDRLMAQEILTASDLETIAVSLGFSNKAAMDNFQCGFQSDMDYLNDHYIAPVAVTAKDNIIVFGSTARYQQTGLYSLDGTQVKNILNVSNIGSCSYYLDSSNNNCYRDYKIDRNNCAEDALIDWGILATGCWFTTPAGCAVGAVGVLVKAGWCSRRAKIKLQNCLNDR